MFNRILLGLVAVSVLGLSTVANAEVFQATYGVAKVFPFKLYNADGTLDVDEADAGTEVSLSCNQGAETTATNDFVDEGTHYSISLTAAELQCQTVVVVVAATTTEVFFIQTSGHASAFQPTLEANVASITAGAVTAAAIATDAIGADEIAADAIGASEIAAAAIAASEIATDAIGSAEVADGAIDAGALATDTITAAKIAADAIGTSELASGAITTAEFAAGAIDAAAIATDAIGAAELAANAIGAAEVADATLDNATFACTGGSFPVLGITDCGTAQSVTGTTLVGRSAMAFADNEAIGQTLLIGSSTTGANQSVSLTDNTGSSDTLTIAAWPATTPTGTITYYLFGTSAATASSGLDAAGVRAAVGLGSANLDTQLGAIDDFVDTEVAAILDDTGTSGVQIPSGEIVAATFGSGAITATVIASDAIGAAEVADGAIDAATLAADTLTAAKVAADVTTELQSGLSTAASVATLQTSVDDIPTNAELATSQAAADDAALAAIAALNDLAASDVWSFVVEDQGSIDAKCMLAAVGAILNGDFSISGTTTTFEDAQGTETRVVSVISGSTRNVTITCPTL